MERGRRSDREGKRQRYSRVERRREKGRGSERLRAREKRGEGERGKHKYVQRELHVYNDAAFVCVCVPRVADPTLKRRTQNTPTPVEKK